MLHRSPAEAVGRRVGSSGSVSFNGLAGVSPTCLPLVKPVSWLAVGPAHSHTCHQGRLQPRQPVIRQSSVWQCTCRSKSPPRQARDTAALRVSLHATPAAGARGARLLQPHGDASVLAGCQACRHCSCHAAAACIVAAPRLLAYSVWQAAVCELWTIGTAGAPLQPACGPITQSGSGAACGPPCATPPPRPLCTWPVDDHPLLPG